MRNKQKILRWLSKHQKVLIFKIAARYYEVLTYIFFGVLTTLVNLVIFTILENVLGQSNWYFSNLPAILLAILFAYLTNRSFVFDSAGGFWIEMYKFFSARIIVSLVFEYGMIYLLYNILQFTAKLDLMIFSISWFKIISTLCVLVANYIASKVFIFKQEDNK
ncbi:MAG: GtrA family protein [Saccharofermentanales bacterium]